MSDRPTVICLMLSSIDGRLHPSRFTKSPQGTAKVWSATYESIHDSLVGDAWLIGRTTMAEMAKGEAHPPVEFPIPDRPFHIVGRTREQYAIAIDRSGKLHFQKPDIGGNPAVVILGSDVTDSHLAELAADGISYLVAPDAGVDLAWAVGALKSELRIEQLLLEGGGEINGAFFAAGLVDELRVLVAPALDAGSGVQGIVAFGEGLAGKTELSLIGCDMLDHGLVQLRYSVAKAV